MENLDLLFEKIAGFMSDYTLVPLLLLASIFFTVKTKGVQFRMIGEMVRLLAQSGKRPDNAPHNKSISSFQAFAVSIASRVGTGNLAGVATAIAIGGPGAVFWMWVIALLGAANAFAESSLAQLFKVRAKDSFMGGPAYYIQKGLHSRWWAVLFAILITLTFGFAFNTVQANTITESMALSFGIPMWVTGVALTVLTGVIIFGGIQRISRFSQWVVPIMAVAYVILALVIVVMNVHRVPEIFSLIFQSAFGLNPAIGGTLGSAMAMGVKRGLFSNEAGEGSTPNAAATADTSHPVKQGLIQALGVYTDTLLICTCTAFIILCSGLYTTGHNGIVLTQLSIDSGLGVSSTGGSTFVCIAIFFFAFTSVIANTYYGETNLRFIRNNDKFINIYRIVVLGMVMGGSVATLKTVWAFADITMALMTICNLAAIVALSKWVILLLKDYQRQRPLGDPQYRRSTLPEIASETECWPE